MSFSQIQRYSNQADGKL